MPKTTADEWFERYLLDHGFDPGEHEPDLSSWDVQSHPDDLPTGDAGQIACEVKQFGKDSKLARRLAEQRYVAASDAQVYGPIRNQVAEAASQLKPLGSRQMPLVVVLANPGRRPGRSQLRSRHRRPLRKYAMDGRDRPEHRRRSR